MKGVWMASVIMPSRWMFWPVTVLTMLNSASCTWPRKMLPVMCLVGGMYFSDASGTPGAPAAHAPAPTGSRFPAGVDLERVAQAHLLRLQARQQANCSLISCEASTVCAASTASAVVR
jgi:hypothetical protein